MDETGRTHDSWFEILYGLALLSAIIAAGTWWGIRPATSSSLVDESGLAISSALQGAFLFVLPLGLFVLGVVMPFWFEVGDRELERFGEAAEFEWEAWSFILFMLYGLVPGAVIGSFVGFLAWISRFLIRPR